MRKHRMVNGDCFLKAYFGDTSCLFVHIPPYFPDMFQDVFDPPPQKKNGSS